MAEFEKRDDSFAFHGEMRALSKSISALESISEDEAGNDAKLPGISKMMWTKVTFTVMLSLLPGLKPSNRINLDFECIIVSSICQFCLTCVLIGLHRVVLALCSRWFSRRCPRGVA